MNFKDMTFEKLAEQNSERWAVLATEPIEKVAKGPGFLGLLTGKGIRTAERGLAESAKGVGGAQSALATAQATAAKPQQAIDKAQKLLKQKKTTREALSGGQRAVDRVKGLFGRGQAADIRKQEAIVKNLKSGRRVSEVPKAQAAVATAKANQEAAKKGLIDAQEAALTARTGTGLALGGAGVLAASSGGGKRNRGPVIVA